MGDRANYAIRENGRVELFYSHWGAATVAADIFWGPAKTEAFIRGNKPADEWLDDVWAQGGIAFDKDRRSLTYYYSEWPDEEDLRRVYELLLAETWQASAWTVRRALGWQEIAMAVGGAPELVTGTPTRPITIPFNQLGQNLARSSCCAILSVRTAQGWQDSAIDFLLPGVLMNGPALIGSLSAVADLEDLRVVFLRGSESDSRKTLGDWIDEYCAIDITARTLRVSLPEHEEDCLSFLQEAWPGWDVRLAPGGAERHFAYTGREMPADLALSPTAPERVAAERSYEECVHRIQEHLNGNEARKALDLTNHLQLI